MLNHSLYLDGKSWRELKKISPKCRCLCNSLSFDALCWALACSGQDASCRTDRCRTRIDLKSKASRAAFTKQRKVQQKLSSFLLTGKMHRALERAIATAGIHEVCVCRPCILAATAANLESEHPTIFNEAEVEDQREYQLPLRVFCICSQAREGDWGVQGAEKHGVFNMGAVQRAFLRAGRAARGRLPWENTRRCRFGAEGPSIQLVRQSRRRELRTRSGVRTRHESDGAAVWGFFYVRKTWPSVLQPATVWSEVLGTVEKVRRWTDCVWRQGVGSAEDKGLNGPCA